MQDSDLQIQSLKPTLEGLLVVDMLSDLAVRGLHRSIISIWGVRVSGLLFYLLFSSSIFAWAFFWLEPTASS